MSRRRRRDGENDDNVLSEDESIDNQEEKLSNESDVGNDDLDVSEYESVDEEAPQSSDEDDEEEGNRAQDQNHSKKAEPDKDGGNLESEEDSQADKEVATKTERESGDGKEQSDSEPHNDAEDEDKSKQKEEDDPAFIPTKGAFFQHDLRSDDQPKGRGRDRRLWDKEPVKWKHDMFVMEEQMPKSRDFLISNYGYDIRSQPLDAPPPLDARRPRGRGRGGYRGRGRGGGRPQRDQQNADFNNKNANYKDDYPALNNDDNSRVKHKSRSYYNRNTNREPPVNKEPTEHPTSRKKEGQEVAVQQKSNASRDEESRSSPKPKSSENKNEEYSDILEVINNHEKQPSSSSKETTPNSMRRNERHSKNQHSTTFSNYQEAPKPRRYSSLRQRQTNSPVDKQNSQYTPRSREPRYANFSKPVQPSANAQGSFQKKSYGNVGGDAQSSVQKQSLKEKRVLGPPVQPAQQPVAPQTAPPVSLPQVPLNVQQPVTFPDPSQANIGAPLDQSLMQMPQMPLSYNPMLNPMYFEAATNYQRMLRMMTQQMSQMNMTVDQLQQIPTSVPPQMDPTAAIPPDPQTLPHPSDMQMNPLLPPVSQTLSPGTLGSVMRPPHQGLNPPTYFSPPMGVNLGAPQQPFPYSPNLVAQQVGGVTYFNTPTQSPPSIPQPPNQASPRRNAAIPIMAPTGFGGPSIVE